MVQSLETVQELQLFLEDNPKAVVDFWAPWCAPCKALAPIFDTLSEEYPAVTFAKIDVQAIPEAAAVFGVRGIPAILGFLDGDVFFREAGAKRDPLAAKLALLAEPEDSF